jgi:fructokinase
MGQQRSQLTGWPRFVSAGEALTDFIRVGPDRWLSRPGGADWNVARVVATLGLSSAFAGSVSLDRFGDELTALSAAAGLDLRFTQRYAKPPLLAMVHETAPPQYFFIGEDSADLAFDPQLLPAGWLDGADWVHFGCISLTRDPLRTKLLRLLDEVKAAGKRVSYDPNFRNIMTETYDATLRYVAERADVIKVSDEDLSGLFRTEHPAEGFARLRAINAAVPILLTRGSEGAELHLPGTVFAQRPPPIDVVDTVGAGDASIGGLLYSLMTAPDAGWAAHLRFSVATGAAACLQAGATPPTLALVERVLTAMPSAGP